MNETALAAEAPNKMAKRAIGFEALANDDKMAGEYPGKTLARFCRFLKCKPDSGGVKPSFAFYRLLLGDGKEAAVEHLRRFQEEVGATPNELRAARDVAGYAKNLGLISYTLNDVKPLDLDESKERIGVYIRSEVAEQARKLAFATGTSLSDTVATALMAAATHHEKRHGPLPTRVGAA